MTQPFTDEDKKTRDRMLSAFPQAVKLGYGPDKLAALVGTTEDECARFGEDPEFQIKLAAEITKAETDGRLLKPMATMLLQKVLERINGQIGEMNAFEAAEVAKPLQRILDAADKRDSLAAKDRYDGLPMLNITIGSNMSMQVVTVEELGTVEADATDVVAKIKPAAAPDVEDFGPPVDAFALLSSAKPMPEHEGDD